MAIAIRLIPVNAFLNERDFRATANYEMKRAERTGIPFIFVVIDLASASRFAKHAMLKSKISAILYRATRDIDARGWIIKNTLAGIICRDTPLSNGDAIVDNLRCRLRENLGPDVANAISLAWYVYPLPNGGLLPSRILDCVADNSLLRKAEQAAKRAIDIVVSLIAIIMLSPLLIAVGGMVKLSSPGPILFRQKRVGYNGKQFTFYKFRSMYADSNDSIHREFVTNLIKGKIQHGADGREIYKIERDPRITPVGRIIRKASIDELPQLFNVLKGDMSLVGPRPAIPYEVEQYQPWHLRRIMGVKPGITGLWQIEGRSRTTFDAMVRMDCWYARTWSVWRDLALIFKTPVAILTAKGAR